MEAVADIRDIVPIKELPPEEYEIEKSKKKVDANDKVVELGPFGVLDALAEAIDAQPPVFRGKSKIVSLRDLRALYPKMRDPVIDGLLRKGEIMNIIAAPKAGKSWLSLDLTLAVIQGAKWFGKFDTKPGRVLIVDNELHKETITFRTHASAQARAIKLDMQYVDDMVDYIPLRGELVDLERLADELADIEPGEYRLIILDAFYRFMPPRTDENDNGQMTSLYNRLDLYANQTDAAICLIHHTTKGLQGGKKVTDVGAGAGVQSRATDTHMILRPHKEPDVIVLDAAVRSFKQPQALCLRRKFPTWEIDTKLNPEDLEGVGTQSEFTQNRQVREVEKERLLNALTSFKTIKEMVAIATQMGLKLGYGAINAVVTQNWEPNGRVVAQTGQKGPKKYMKSGTQPSTQVQQTGPSTESNDSGQDEATELNETLDAASDFTEEEIEDVPPF